MPREHVLAIDEGTTGVRALVVDVEGGVLGQAYCPIETSYPRPGLVEHDPEGIWEATLTVIRRALDAAASSPDQIAAIGVATQRATTVLWDAKTNRAVHPALSWQDQRTAARCEELVAQGRWVNPLASATKIEWLLANARPDGIPLSQLRAGTIDSWLTWKLTGGRSHVTDPSNASCTALYDFVATWDPGSLEAVGVPAEILPEVGPSSGLLGHTAPSVLGTEIPVCGLAGDQQAAMFGQLCVEPGSVKATFGTSAMFDLNTGSTPILPDRGTVPLVLWRIDDEQPYCLEGSAITAGAAVQWLGEGLGLFERPDDCEALAASVPDGGGVWAVPAFQGLGTPHMLPGVHAAIGGLSRGTTRAHVARALLEGVAFRGREVFETLLACGGVDRPETLRVNGGASRNDLLMQTQADVLGTPVERPENVEATAIGAAFLAGRGIGLWKDLEALRGRRRIGRIFEPKWSEAYREERWSRWQAVLRATIQTGAAS